MRKSTGRGYGQGRQGKPKSTALRVEQLEERALLSAGSILTAIAAPVDAPSPASLSCVSHSVAATAPTVQTGAPSIRVTNSAAAGVVGGVNFGRTVVGQHITQTLTISNPGTAALTLTGSAPVQITGPQAGDYQVTQPSITAIPPGGSVKFSISFSPQAPGTRSATVSIGSNASSAGSLSLAVTGTGLAPVIGVTGNAQFGSVQLGQSVTRIFTITNPGTATLTLIGSTPVQVTGAQAGDFRAIQPYFWEWAIPSGGSVQFAVTFTPSAVGNRSATATISSNAFGNGSCTIAIAGTGVAPAISVAPSGQFPATVVGQSTTQTFTLSNPGTANLVLTSGWYQPLVQISGPQAGDFRVTQPSVTVLPPGASTTFSITFTPASPGACAATATITSNAFGQGSYQLAISGTAAAAAIGVTGVSQFGQAAIGQVVTQTFTITNSGTANLTLTGAAPVQIAGPQASDYQVTQPSVTTVAPGDSTTFSVSFSPLGPGSRTATVTIGSNALGKSSYVLTLTGVGPGTAGQSAFTVPGIPGSSFSGPTLYNGINYFTVQSPYESTANWLRVMTPTSIVRGVQYRVIYVLPVEAGLGTQFGDGLTTLQSLGVQNTTNAIYVEPSFSGIPWYADNATSQNCWQETYFTSVIVPFIDAMYPTLAAPAGRLLLGYSKSGYGAFSLLLRHPDLFGRAYAWNSPLDMSNPATGDGFSQVLGTAANFQNYQISTLLQEEASEFQGQPARFFFGGQSYEYPTLINDEQTIDQLMTSLNIAHVFTPGSVLHHLWNSGWMAAAVNTLLSP
jgi:hypothetical protein